MDENPSVGVANWLRSRVGEPITARSTALTPGGVIVPLSVDDVSFVPTSASDVRHGGQAATCPARVTVGGEQWQGKFAVRAQLVGSGSQAKRVEAMRVAHIASSYPIAREVLPGPWHTAQTKVPALDVESDRDGEEIISLDFMQWAEPFESAFEGLSVEGRAERAVELAVPLFSGLDYIHTLGRVHRDIDAGNVMFVDKHLIFIDWGITSVVMTGTSTYTDQFGKMGSPYMAPESRTGRRVDKYVDVWALGVLLCRMACGHDPILRSSDTGEIELPAAARRLPGWLREIIDGLTQFDRHDRMTLSDAVSALRDAGRSPSPVGSRRDVTASSSTTAAPATTAGPPDTSVLLPTEGDGPADRLARARELLDAGYAHGKAGRVKAALAAYASAAEICEGDADLGLRQHLAMALNNSQWELYRSSQHAEALAICSRLVDTFGHDPDLVLRQQVAIALNGGAYAKREFGLGENAVADWDQVVDRFGGDPDLVLRHQVAMALRDKGLSLAELDRRMDALSAFTQLIESFEHDPDPVLRQQVAMALNNKRSYLYKLGHRAEAAAACTRLAETFGADRDPIVRHQLIIALVSKGLILERSGQQEGAMAAYGRLIDIFADDTEPTIQGSVKWARERLRNR